MANPEIVPVATLSPEWRELFQAAWEARQQAYAPYSHFPVGAAVRAIDSAGGNRLYAGSNVENSAYGLTVCAERVAIWKAVSEGGRALTALAVVTDTGATPCGACLQVIVEFAEEDLPILIADERGRAWLTMLRALLPHPFPRATIYE